MTMIVLFFVVLGLAGYTKLSSDLFPKTNIPYITVVTSYPGAGAEEIEKQVLKPLEEAVAPVTGLKQNIATASEGLASMVLEFSMTTDADGAVSDVQKAIDEAVNKLPDGAETPVIRKYNFNEQPIMTLVLSGDRPLEELNRIAEDSVKQNLESLPGVGRVEILGGREREVQVLLDREKLEDYALSINYIIERIGMENVNIPAGTLHFSPDTQFTVRLLGEFNNTRELANLNIPFRGGTVKLGELGTITEGNADITRKFHLNGREAVGIVIQKQSDASIVETASRIEEELKTVQALLPGGTKLILAQNSATFIKDSLNETVRTLVEGVLMCGFVLALFLRNWRSVFTVMLAIPTSIISTFFAMKIFGFTLNFMSLMALSLAVGLLIDDAIVVIENIVRHLQTGKTPFAAAKEATAELGLAVTATTLTVVAVFLPVGMMTGVVGQFFKQFGITVVFSVLVSLLVAFTLVPLLASRHLKKEEHVSKGPVGKFLAWFNRGFDRVTVTYADFLKVVLRNRYKTLGLALLLFVGSLMLVRFLGSSFVPSSDMGELTVVAELDAGLNLDAAGKATDKLENIIHGYPEVVKTYSTTETEKVTVFVKKSCCQPTWTASRWVNSISSFRNGLTGS